jgi:polysaccharide export outer membrane protein
VQPDGYVSLVIGGDLKVAGLNVEQARQAILRRASTRLREPVGTIILKEFQKPYFVVAGKLPSPAELKCASA